MQATLHRDHIKVMTITPNTLITIDQCSAGRPTSALPTPDGAGLLVALVT